MEVIMEDKKRFYDIHCHTTSLCHPCFYAFMRRFKYLIPVAGSAIGLGMQLYWIFRKRRIKNLLSIMERSIEEMLYEMEEDLTVAFTANNSYNGPVFEEYVITPLLMDFWNRLPDEHNDYPFCPKSIVHQVTEIFNGIADYAHTVRGTDLDCLEKLFHGVSQYKRKRGPEDEWRLAIKSVPNSVLPPNVKNEFGPQRRKMKAFPFMGLDTRYCFLKNHQPKAYENTCLEDLLEKYFSAFPAGKEERMEKLEDKFGAFNGDINGMDSGFFAGIKVYPPLGFDPWPDDNMERDKVKYLYGYCRDKQIPITTHCSDGGYVVDTNREGEKKSEESAIERSHPGKWRGILQEFHGLKLNLAHFGGANSGYLYAASPGPQRMYEAVVTSGGDPGWVKEIIHLVNEHDHVYTDMAFSGVKPDYYKALSDIITRNQKLRERLLFGTDFSVNLTDINTYKAYLENFFATPYLDSALKIDMCSGNPERFLFGF